MTERRKNSGTFERSRAARIAAVQGFFQIESVHLPLAEVLKEFINFRFQIREDFPVVPDILLFEKLLGKALERRADIQPIIENTLTEEWSYERLDPVLRAVLSISTGEFLEKFTSLPGPVLISEYVDITRGFLGGKEPAFVNRYLDQLAKNLGYSMKKT